MDKKRIVSAIEFLSVPLWLAIILNFIVMKFTVFYPNPRLYGNAVQLFTFILIYALLHWRTCLIRELKEEGAVVADERDTKLRELAIHKTFYITAVFIVILGLVLAFDTELLGAADALVLTLFFMVTCAEFVRLYLGWKGKA